MRPNGSRVVQLVLRSFYFFSVRAGNALGDNVLHEQPSRLHADLDNERYTYTDSNFGDETV